MDANAKAFGLVSDNCQKNRLNLQQHFVQDAGRPLKPWRCTLTVLKEGGSVLVERSADAASKRDAKNFAADALIPYVISASGREQDVSVGGAETKSNRARKSKFSGNDIFHVAMQLGLLEHIWPADRVLVGLQVCKWMRHELPQYSPAFNIVMQAKKPCSQPSHQQDGGAGDSQELSDDETRKRICRSLKRLRKSKVSLLCQNAASISDVILDAIASAFPFFQLHPTNPRLHMPFAALDFSMHFLGGGRKYEKVRKAMSIVGRCPALSLLDVSSNELGWQSISDLVTLCAAHSLTMLSIANNVRYSISIEQEPVARLAQHLASCAALRHLALSRNNFGSHPVLLATLLRGCSHVTHLELEGCKLMLSQDQVGFIPELQTLSHLQHLSLRNNFPALDPIDHDRDLDVVVMEVLFWALKGCSQLKSLDLSETCLLQQPNSAQSLAALLAQHSGLTSLALRSASINHANSCIIAPSLALCTGLTSLELAFNSLAAPDILLFTSSFPPSLLSLDLSANPLFAAGICHLADALSFTPALTSLALAHCHMGANGAKSLAKALLDCPLLQSLDVTDNSLGTQGLSHLGTWLRSACSTRRLHTVCLGFNELGDEGAQRLAKLLRGGACSALTRLELSHNQLGPTGASALAEALRALQSALSAQGSSPLTYTHEPPSASTIAAPPRPPRSRHRLAGDS